MFLSLIQKRRSIRTFLKKEVAKPDIDKLIEAALRAPSSRSLNPWEFIVVKNPDTLAELSRCKPHGASFLKDAPLGIVVIADPEKCDVWIEDTSIASTYIQLQAGSMGLGSCWIQIRKRDFSTSQSAEERVKTILHIPENRVVESIIALGWPGEKKLGHPGESLLYNRVFYEDFR
jgi:nitroreductase